MSKRMLIDASHSEETRVAILNENKLEEFLYESALRKPLKGNIYLAKVTRVEPSLQAAFVNYGGNRHGFLPFSEIHPDYFRIPVADQEEFEAMQREQLEEHDKYAKELESVEPAEGSSENGNVEEIKEVNEISDINGNDENSQEAFDNEEENMAAFGNEEDDEEEEEDESETEENNTSEEGDETHNAENDEEGENNRDRNRGRGRGRFGRGGRGKNGRSGGRRAHGARRPENFGDDEAGQASRFRFNLRRKYKIQEVIKRGQIMLIQVSREERGNKGAAVSTYLSLPGRYCVLMPNSPRGGGVSRKISNYQDRSKMKDLQTALAVPPGMSTIVRTAGVTRTKTEVKRDLDYLMRLWNSIRELTLQSSAPALVYEEANLIKRAVRDLYTRDIDEVLVAGDEGHKTARDFMKMLIPSHAKKVEFYESQDIPLFHRYQVEQQIAAIGETEVTLPSGGYLVINPTEALVSIDVNSGRSTKERNIEGTALKTNLEAADEVARQLRLRDLGGLVVIDFIDMEDRRNNGKVERRMREALANDKARVQVGRISSFGLMELSRQRLNASLSEAQFETCCNCEGRGLTRTADATSLLVLRAIEAEGIRKRAAQVIAHVPSNVALYLLNFKRSIIAEIEARYELQILIRIDDELAASNFRVEVSRPADTEEEEEQETGREKRAPRPEQAPAETDEEKEERRPRNRRGGRGRNRNRNRRDNEDGSNAGEPNGNAIEEDGNDISGNVKEEPFDRDGNSDAPKGRNRGKPPAKAAAKKIEIVEEDAKAAKPADDKNDKKAEKSDKEDKAVKDEKKDDKKAKAKKPAKKPSAAEKKEEAKTTGDKADKEKPAPKSGSKSASNDDAPATRAAPAAPPAPKEYEKVNEAPEQKRKGWWNKLTD
jgi:ribonuclease E